MAHQSPLIFLPPKTTEDVDFGPALRQIIAHTYQEPPAGYAEEIGVLGRCRADAVGGAGRGAGSDVTARDLLYKYFGQLELLELRFADMKVPFVWKDAFDGKTTTQTSLAFEKASVIFLLASVLSSIAASASRASPEGIKRAYNSSRTAAGMLTFINENFLHAPSTDLSREVVKLLSGTMITQAGEILVDKAVGEAKPPSLVARMAQGVAKGYAGLVDEVKEFQGKGIIDRAWLGVLAVKAKLFASLAHYYRAKHDDAKGDHGAALVRFDLAHKLAKDAEGLAKEFSYSYVAPFGTTAETLPAEASTTLLELVKTHTTVCAEAKEQAHKDNDLVYHSLPPSEASLPSIEVLITATPIPIQEIYANPEVANLIGPDIFRRLIPLEVHTSASVYSEEKAKLGRGESERVAASEGEVRAALEDMGMPGKIRRYRQVLEGESDAAPSGPSSEVRGWADRVANNESRRGEGIEDMLRRIDEAKSSCRARLDAMTRDLDDESRECEKMRVKYGHLWTQAPSGAHSRQYRDAIRQHYSSLSAAESSDDTVVGLYNSTRQDIDLLRGGSSRVSAVMAAAASGKPAQQPNLLDLDTEQTDQLDGQEARQLDEAIGELEEKIQRLEAIRSERDEVLKDLKDKIQADDVSHLLLLNRRSQGVEPTLFATELEKFRPYQSRISAAIASQRECLHELGAICKRVDSGKSMRDVQRRWNAGAKSGAEMEGRLHRAWDAYEEIVSGLKKGTHFYDSMKTLVDGLERDVRHFVTSRTNERTRLASDANTRNRLVSPPPATSPPVSPPPTSSSGMRSLEQQLTGVSLSGSSDPYRSYGAPAAPPAQRLAQSAYPPPPPPQRNTASSPYDFGSIGGGSSPFSTASSPPPSDAYVAPPPPSNQYSALPPPPSRPTYPSMPSSSSSAYPAPPAHTSYPSQRSPYSPPPPAQPDYRHAPSQYPAPPAPPSDPYRGYAQPTPRSDSYGSYPAPPRGGPPPLPLPGQYGAPPPHPSYPSQFPPPPQYPSAPQHDPYRYGQR